MLKARTNIQKDNSCTNTISLLRHGDCAPEWQLPNQLSEYANSILKIEVEKSVLEDKTKIGSLSTIQLETEHHIVEIFGSRSSVGVYLHHMRGPKGGQKYTEALVQSLRNNGVSI